MTPEEIWRRKSDEELVAASHRLSEYTEVGQRVIIAELHRRRESGVMSESASGDEAREVEDSTGASDGDIDLPHGYLRRLWRGYIPLPMTYWVWGVVANLVWVILVVFAEVTNIQTLVLFLGALGLAYYVFACVAIWRSSGRYRGKRIWAELARISLAAGIARTVVDVFAVFARP